MARINHRTARKEYKCSQCGDVISPGVKYQWAQRRYGPKIVRCMKTECAIKRWELTGSDKLADLWRIEDELGSLDPAAFEDTNSLSVDLQGYAEQIREVAERYSESASNIEDGFGHSTMQSEELEEKASEVESWADDIENAASAIEAIEILCDCGHGEDVHKEMIDTKVWHCTECKDEHAYTEDIAWQDEAFSLIGDVSSSPL